MGKFTGHRNGHGRPLTGIVAAITALLLTVAAFSADFLTLSFKTVLTNCAVVFKTGQSKLTLTDKFIKRQPNGQRTREPPTFYFDSS